MLLAKLGGRIDERTRAKKQTTTRVEDDPSHKTFLKITSWKIPLMQL
jgi:hypothetical protein